MLSTDGVHEFVGDAETLALIAQADDLAAAAQAIAEAALANGSGDNLTVQLRARRRPAQRRGRRPARRRARPAARAAARRPATASKAMRSCASSTRAAAATSISRATRPTARASRSRSRRPSTRGDEGELAALLLEEWVMRRVVAPEPAAAGAAARAARAYLRGRAVHRGADARPVDGATIRARSLPQVRDILGQLAAGAAGAAPARDAPPRPAAAERADRRRRAPCGSSISARSRSPGSASWRRARPRMRSSPGRSSTPRPSCSSASRRAAQSDLFSLGVIAYQMLTGALPYGTRSPARRRPRRSARLRYRPAREHDPDAARLGRRRAGQGARGRSRAPLPGAERVRLRHGPSQSASLVGGPLPLFERGTRAHLAHRRARAGRRAGDRAAEPSGARACSDEIGWERIADFFAALQKRLAARP